MEDKLKRGSTNSKPEESEGRIFFLQVEVYEVTSVKGVTQGNGNGSTRVMWLYHHNVGAGMLSPISSRIGGAPCSWE
jgi:hypothetical protein